MKIKQFLLTSVGSANDLGLSVLAPSRTNPGILATIMDGSSPQSPFVISACSMFPVGPCVEITKEDIVSIFYDKNI